MLLPLKVTVPVLELKLPVTAQLPDTFMFPFGAVKLPVIDTLLNVLTLLPLIAVVPLNTTVPALALNAPEFAQLPDTFKFFDEEVMLPDVMLRLATLMSPEEPVKTPPLIVKPPLKLCVLLEA